MSTVAAVALAYAVLCAALYVGQRHLIYFPRPEVVHARAEAVWFSTGEERLKLWRLPGTGSNAVLYFGGNAEDVASNIPDYRQWFPEHTVYLVNYRGFGGSSGRPSEAGLFADALALYDELAGRHDNIAVIGRSLGSGVAVYLAAEREVNRLVLVTPFDSVASVARRVMPIFPTRWLLRDQFDSVRRAPDISAPVLVLVAEEDGVIPRPHSDTLIAAFGPAQLSEVVIRGADHNSVHILPAYAESLRAFLAPTGPGL